jgi:hypothetical protein
VETKTGTIIHAFTDGTMIQVFLLAQELPPGDWAGTGPQP